ncbi:gliding motility-associated C-terminal domain-containing protein [Hymenobacter bucti]|uniref:Gliding motility-associated C-terminal domain-containing protein n=1 Tax=Hymenobacter bucti TaxID=1844114 RepID=A0ABW4QRD6_9BACT
MQKNLYLLLSILLLASRLATAQVTPVTDGRTLQFIPNQGQWPAAVRYAGAVPGGHLYLEPTGLHYVLLEAIRHPHEPAGHAPNAGQLTRPAAALKAANLPAADSPIRGHQLRVRFVGADVTTPLVPAETTGETYNYLQGNDPARWAKGVPSYRQVRYQAPWPGIGARFYENKQQQLEYDFELAAGANPALVKLKYQGASSLRLGSDGRLHVGTSVANLTELAPQAYQTNPATGQPQPVACHYRLNLADSTVTFALGQYDRSRPLVIDPTVQFSTYTGARSDNWGFTATYDAAGNMYSGGIVLSEFQASLTSFPTTVGAFQTQFGGVIDIAIIKYNTAANGAASRVWATYLGGDSHDYPSSLVVNSQNELVMLGTTSSSNYPTSASAVQRNFRGGTAADPFGDATGDSFFLVSRGTDIVVTRLNSNGGLAASTYLGGSGTDGLVPFVQNSTARQLPQNYGDAFRGDVLTDAAGNIYVASVTSSTDFPTTSGSFGTSSRGGTSDAVVLKLPAALNTVTWSGYLGGNAADAAYSLQLDASSNVYVTGGTLSPNFPVTSGALLTAAQGNVDGFVARIAANGASIQRATYLGTSSYDQSYFLQLGADGGVYLLGQTMGPWPITAGAYSNAGSHQFIQKLSADLDQRLLSTVFGSGRTTIDISPTAFLVDQCDRVYVCGWGGNNNQAIYTSATFRFNGYTHGLPVTTNAVRSAPDTPGAGSDFYLAQFSPGLTRLLYGTYYGNAGVNSVGDHVDGGTSRFDPRGVVYTAVCSCSNNASFPIPAGAYSYSTTNNSSNCNNAAFKLNFEPQTATVGLDQTVCATAAAVPLVGTPSGGVWTGAGVTGSVTAGYVFTPSTALVGVQTLTYTLAGVIPVCTATGTQRITVAAVGPAVLSALPQAAYCLQPGTTIAPVALVGSPAGGVFSGPGVTGNQFSPTAAGPGRHTITYAISAGTPCASLATQVVTVVQATAGAALTLCVSSPAVALTSGQPAGGTWSGPGVSGSAATGYVFAPTAAMSGTTQILTYSVPAPDGSCAATTTQSVTVVAGPQVSVRSLPGVCAGSGALALTAGQPAGGTWSGPGVSGSAATGYVFTPTAALLGTQTLTYTLTSVLGCTGQATLTVEVSPAAVQIAMPADTALCPGSSRAFQLRASPAGGVWSGTGVTASGLFTPPSAPGTVAMLYTMGSGTPCATSATRRITLLAAPTLAPTEQPLVCRADSSVASSSAPAVAPYTVRFSQPSVSLLADAVLTWDFGDGSAPATGLSVSHTYTKPGSFQPTATLRYSGSHCSVQVSLAPVQVQEPLIPNVFTPNGDQQNDFFAPRLGGCQPRLQVFTRWGQKVYESPAYFNNWDGQGQAAGIYYFLITPTDGRAPIKGWVELIR